ncbi:MAG: M1 family aminopeptidase [Candidatus Omnitrophota bacterium]
MSARKLLWGISFFIFMLTAIAGSAAADRIADGFRLFPPKKIDGVFNRSYQPERTVDCEHLTLEIKVFMKEMRIEATAKYQFRPLYDGVSSIRFDAKDMKIEKVECDAPGSMDWTYADNALLITFSQSLPMDRSYNMSIAYSAAPKEGMYFSDSQHAAPVNPDQLYTLNEPNQAKNWFPCLDYPNDRMVTEMIATVPKEFVTLSNGLLVESKEEGEWRTDVWKQKIPHVVYLVSLVVGHFDIVRDDWKGIPVEYYVEKGLAKDARPSMGKTPAMIDFFSDFFGYPYPYEKYAQAAVRDFRAGGMEHTTATTLHEWTVMDEEARLDADQDGLIAHELSHQWFGDLITCKSWPELWLNEGFATYSDALWFQHAEGEDRFLDAMMGNMVEYINSSRSYTRPIVDNRFANPDEMFDSHSYPKGACVLHMLRNQLGDDLYRKIMKRYLEKFAPGLVDTDDFLETIQEVSGRPMDRFFEQWIYTPGHPKIKASHEWLPKLKQVRVRLQQTQEAADGAPAYAFPLEIDVATKSGILHHTADIAKKDETVSIHCQEPPISVDINPRLKVLMELAHEKSQEMLLEELQNGSTIVIRLRALSALSGKDDERIIDALAKRLNEDSYWKVQSEAAEVIGRFQTEKTKKILLAACHHPNPKVRRTVVSQLGKFYKDKDAFEAAADRFKNDKSIYVIAAAADSLQRIKLDGVYSILRPGLDRESYRDTVRSAALNALIELEEPRIYSELDKFSKDPYSRGIRMTAMRGLGELAEKTKKNANKTREMLLEYLQSSSDRIRSGAISGLQALKDEKAIPHLHRVAKDDASESLRSQADNAIKEIRREKGSQLSADNAKRLDDLFDQQKKFETRVKELEETVKRLEQQAEKSEAKEDSKN